LLSTIALDNLIIPNGEGARFFLDVKNLHHSESVNSSLLVFKFKFAILSPILRSFEFEKRPFRISGVDPKAFGVIDL
jgi:hypothetical protein